jgi:ElaB/YqjD/DUF883 family membrane-anchored ribosome-binding protein
MNSLEVVLHQLGTLISNPALGGGSNLGFARAAQILHWFGDAVSAGEDAKPQLEQLVADIEALAKNHGNPAKGQWEAMVERAQQVQAIIKDAEAVVETVKAKKAAKATPAPKANPTKDTSGEQKLDPQP